MNTELIKRTISLAMAIVTAASVICVSKNVSAETEKILDINNGKCECTQLCPSHGFTDVPDSESWMHGGIDFALKRGIFGGTDKNKFSPDTEMTRAMTVQILAKIDGADLSEYTYSGKFADVKSGDWFANAVEWAVANKITSGVGANSFSPDGKLTREQLATFFLAYSNYKGYDTSEKADISSYPDAGAVSEWAKNGVSWAVENKLISGVASGDKITLSPKQSATRAQTATIAKAYVTKIQKCLGNVMILGDSYSTFEDWNPEMYSVYYYDTHKTVNTVDKTWWYKLINETGSTFIVNESYSGTTVSDMTYNNRYSPKTSFVGRLRNYIENNDASVIDTVVILGGTNDSWANIPVGEEKYTDITTEDLKTFLPAFIYMLEIINEKMPNATVINVVNCDLREDITSGMQRACEKLGVTCVMLYDIAKEDGHPNNIGMEQIKNQILDELGK